MAPAVRELLAFAVKHGKGKDGLLFAPWPNARRGIAYACKKIGAPAVTFNDLRRTLATWLIEGGVSTYVVSKVLRHKSETMVHLVYGKPTDEAVGDLLERQSSGVSPVRVVYVSQAERSRSQRKGRPQNPQIPR